MVIAAYRASAWILDCLAAVRAQEPLDGWQYELRLGVDACEETSAALRKAGIGHWWSPENVGPYLIRNALTRDPADAYATFDADDLMPPAYLRTVLPLVGVGIAGSARQDMDEKGRANGPVRTFKHGVGIYSAQALAKLGGFRAWRIAADRDAVARAKMLGIPVSKTKEVRYLRRQHPAQLTSANATGLGSTARREAYKMTKAGLKAKEFWVDPVCAKLEWRSPWEAAA